MAHPRPCASSAVPANIPKELRRFITQAPLYHQHPPCEQGRCNALKRHGGAASRLVRYFTTNIDVGAEPVLVVETNVNAPLDGVILKPEIVLEV